MEEIREYVTKQKISILMENQKNVYNQYYNKYQQEGKIEVLDILDYKLKKEKSEKEILAFLEGLAKEASDMMHLIEERQTI